MDYTSIIIAIVSTILAGAGTSIGIYVKFNNELNLANYRINSLERSNEHLSARIDMQEDKLGKLLSELKEDIHDLRLLIEQTKKQST